MKSTDPHIEYKGKKFYYRIVEGPEKSNLNPAVFISGAFQNMDSWKRFEQEFIKQRTVVLVDLPGTGKSDILSRDAGIDFLAGSLEKLFAEIGLEGVDILSTSYGTPIAHSFTKKNPSLVSNLILGGIMKRIPDELWEATNHTLKAIKNGDMHKFAMEIIEGLTYRVEPKNIFKFKLVEKLLYSTLTKMNHEDREKYMENTLRLLHHDPIDTTGFPDVRTLVFTGEYDVYTSPESCREIAASMPNSVFTTIQNTDHMFSLERFDVMMDLLMDFLSANPTYCVAGCNKYEIFCYNYK